MLVFKTVCLNRDSERIPRGLTRGGFNSRAPVPGFLSVVFLSFFLALPIDFL